MRIAYELEFRYTAMKSLNGGSLISFSLASFLRAQFTGITCNSLVQGFHHMSLWRAISGNQIPDSDPPIRLRTYTGTFFCICLPLQHHTFIVWVILFLGKILSPRPTTHQNGSIDFCTLIPFPTHTHLRPLP